MLKKVASCIFACVMATGAFPNGISFASAEYEAVTLSPDIYSNASRNYYEGNGGFASNGKFISADGFMAMDIWKNEWNELSEWENNAEVNTLTFKGIEYEVRLVNPKKDSPLSGFASASSSANEAVNIDIPDGKYIGVSFLGGADSSASSTTGAVRFNYTDNSNSGWITYTQSKVSSASNDALAVPAKKYSSGNVVDADYIYLYQINVMADSSKTMESFDIIVRNAYIEEDGTVTLKATSGATGYRYYSRYAAMSMLADKEQAEKEKIEKIRDIIDTLPSADEFVYSDENIEKLYKIRDIRKTVDESVISEENYKAVLSSADEYIKLIEKIAIQKNNERIDKIAQMLKELPSLEDMTLSADNILKLDEINKALDEVDLTLEISSKRQEIINEVKSYNDKVGLLRAAENDKKAEEIKKILDTLPAIEEFEKTETYTDEVIESLKKIQSLLDEIDWTAGVSNQYKEILSSAEEYAAKADYIHVLENAKLIEEIEKILSTLPSTDDFKYTRQNESLLEELSELSEKLAEDYLKDEEKELYEKAKSYTALLKNFPPISKPLNPDIFANSERTYFTDSGFAAYDSIGIEWEGFTKLNIWENPWSFTANKADNIIDFNGISYGVRVVSDGKSINSAYFGNAGTSVGYDTFDVDDGKYVGISFLGGAAHAGSGYSGVCFNYSDGTTSGFLTQKISKLNAASENAIEIPAVNGNNSSKTSLYLYQYNFDNPNPEKTVVSVSIPYRNVTITNGEITTINPTSGGLAYNYWVRWLGMTMLQTSKEYKNIIKDKFLNLLNVKEENEKTALEEVDTLVQSAVKMGMDITDIEGYDIYKRLSDKYVRIFGYEKTADLKAVTVTVTFASDVNIEKADIILAAGEKEQDFELSYKDNIAKITFKNTFDYESEYTLKLSKNISSRKDGGNTLGSEAIYSFNIPKVVAFSDFSVRKDTDSMIVDFTLNNYLEDVTDMLVTLCVADSSNRIIDSAVIRARDIKKGENLTASDILLKSPKDCTLKVFIIDNMENMNTIYKYQY